VVVVSAGNGSLAHRAPSPRPLSISGATTLRLATTGRLDVSSVRFPARLSGHTPCFRARHSDWRASKCEGVQIRDVTLTKARTHRCRDVKPYGWSGLSDKLHVQTVRHEATDDVGRLTVDSLTGAIALQNMEGHVKLRSTLQSAHQYRNPPRCGWYDTGHVRLRERQGLGSELDSSRSLRGQSIQQTGRGG
jgi:hypothetical protein